MTAVTVLAIAALALFALIALDARSLARTDSKRARRARLDHQRRIRDDQAYGDALAEARVMMRPSIVSLPRRRANFDSYLAATSHHSRKVAR